MAADPTNAGRGGNRSSGTARTGGIVAARPSARSVHGGGPRGTAGQRRVPLRARGRDTDREPLARACLSADGHVAPPAAAGGLSTPAGRRDSPKVLAKWGACLTGELLAKPGSCFGRCGVLG